MQPTNNVRISQFDVFVFTPMHCSIGFQSTWFEALSSIQDILDAFCQYRLTMGKFEHGYYYLLYFFQNAELGLTTLTLLVVNETFWIISL